MAHPVPTRDNTHTYSLAEDARRNVKSCKGFLAFSVPGNSAVEGCDFGLLCLDTAEVTGSIPVAPTTGSPWCRCDFVDWARAFAGWHTLRFVIASHAESRKLTPFCGPGVAQASSLAQRGVAAGAPTWNEPRERILHEADRCGMRWLQALRSRSHTGRLRCQRQTFGRKILKTVDAPGRGRSQCMSKG